MSFSIKPLRKADALKAAQILHDAWHNHFSLYMPKENVEAMTLDACQQGWERILANADDKFVILGAFVDEDLAGTLLMGPAREKDCFDVELWSMQVASQHRRLGIGAKLFEQSRKELHEAGSTHFYLNCIDQNVSARRFYDSLGGELLPMLRMRKGYKEVVYAFPTAPESQLY